jgi:NodT family efflux transporter outer membrane factor (OMF) lipoprotein
LTRARLIATAALVTALAGCKAVGPNFEQPTAPAGAGYRMAGDADVPLVQLVADERPAGAWWKALGSPQLDAVMTQALADNRTVAEADANLEAARQQAASVRGQQAPQLDLSASAQEERFNIAAFGISGFPNPTLSLYSVGGTVSYDADLFGGRRRATEQALAQAQSQARHADAAYLTLTGQTAMAALQIAATRAQIEAVDQAIADDRHLIEIVRKAESAGGEPTSATVSGKTQLAQDEALLPPLQQQLAQSRHALALLVGQSPSGWTAPDFDLAEFTPPATIPVSLPSALIRRRPDILAAEADLHAATANVGVATAALYPDIKLSANLIQTALTPGGLFSYANSGWALGAGLTQPLFDGGTLKANQRVAQARAKAAMAHYQATVLSAFTQVADTMQAISNDDASIVALTRAEDVAQSNLNDQQTALRLGGGTLLPVIDAERQLVMTRRTLVMAKAKRTADIAQLFVATAADWRDAG